MRSEKGAGLKSQKGLPDPRPWTIVDGNYSGRHHLDATNKMILYPLPHKSI